MLSVIRLLNRSEVNPSYIHQSLCKAYTEVTTFNSFKCVWKSNKVQERNKTEKYAPKLLEH